MQWKLCFAQRLNRLGGCYIKDFTKEPVEEPFFARYLDEGQLSEEEQKAVVGAQ